MRISFLTGWIGSPIIFLLASCQHNPSTSMKAAAPIVLGDPKTIVTETDSQYLRDQFELYPLPGTLPPSTPNPLAGVSSEEKPSASPAEATAPAWILDIDGLKIRIEGLKVKGEGDAVLLDSATWGNPRWEVVAGSLESLNQRYQTIIRVEPEMGVMYLRDLKYLSDWEKLDLDSPLHPLQNLKPEKLKAVSFTRSKLNQSISREARRRNFRRSYENQWINAASKARNAHQKPLSPYLVTVIWRISGKNPQGKTVSRQVRVDLPH